MVCQSVYGSLCIKDDFLLSRRTANIVSRNNAGDRYRLVKKSVTVATEVITRFMGRLLGVKACILEDILRNL